MRDRIFRRGKVKFRIVHTMTGDHFPYIVCNQHHHCIYDSTHSLPYLFSEIQELGVTSIYFTDRVITYYVYTPPRWVRAYLKATFKVYGYCPPELVKELPRKPIFLSKKKKYKKPPKKKVEKKPIPKHLREEDIEQWH